MAGRNLRQYRGRLVTLVLGSVVSLVCVGMVGHAAAAAQSSINEGVALRTIELKAESDRPDDQQLHADALAGMAALPGVVSVEPWAQASIGIKTADVSGALLYATSVRASLPPPVVQGVRGNVLPLAAGEVLLPATSQGQDFRRLIGQRVPVTYTRKVAEGQGEAASDQVTVVGVYDPAFALDGPSAAYTDNDSVLRWAAAKVGVPASDYVATVGYREAFVVVGNSADTGRVLDRLRAEGYAANSVQETLTTLPTGMRTYGFWAS